MQLPSKASDLIRLAINDLSKIERSKEYQVSMLSWHEPSYNNIQDKQLCTVCLAGSVMAKTLKSNRDHTYWPDDFGEKNSNKLSSLDEFRMGNIESAFQELGLTMYEKFLKTSFPSSVEIVGYSKENSKKFKKQMRNLARRLKNVGL